MFSTDSIVLVAKMFDKIEPFQLLFCRVMPEHHLCMTGRARGCLCWALCNANIFSECPPPTLFSFYLHEVQMTVISDANNKSDQFAIVFFHSYGQLKKRPFLLQKLSWEKVERLFAQPLWVIIFCFNLCLLQ